MSAGSGRRGKGFGERVLMNVHDRTPIGGGTAAARADVERIDPYVGPGEGHGAAAVLTVEAQVERAHHGLAGEVDAEDGGVVAPGARGQVHGVDVHGGQDGVPLAVTLVLVVADPGVVPLVA